MPEKERDEILSDGLIITPDLNFSLLLFKSSEYGKRQKWGNTRVSCYMIEKIEKMLAELRDMDGRVKELFIKAKGALEEKLDIEK